MKVDTMKAIVLEAPGVLKYTTVPVPTCGPQEVLIKVRALCICGTDVEMFHGHIPPVNYPIIPGHEWSGQIVAVGNKVTKFSVGDHVVGETTISCGHCNYCKQGRYNLCQSLMENGIVDKNGAAAEYMVYPEFGLHLLHPEIPFEQACLIEPAAIAFRGLQKIKINPGDTLAVIGPGPIGLLTTAMAKVYGVRKVVLIGFQQNRLALGLKLGADHIIDLSKEDYLERAMACTNGEGFTAIVEASGNAQACEQLFSIAAPASRVCLLGSYGENLPKIDVTKIVLNDMEVHGSRSSPSVWEAVVRLSQNMKYKITDLITHEFALQDYEKALQLIEKQDPSLIKVLLKP